MGGWVVVGHPEDGQDAGRARVGGRDTDRRTDHGEYPGMGVSSGRSLPEDEEREMRIREWLAAARPPSAEVFSRLRALLPQVPRRSSGEERRECD